MSYHNSKIIKIKKIDISGVNNPVLFITGYYCIPNSKLEFYIDDLKVKENDYITNELLFFEYHVLFNNSAHNIEIYLIENKQKKLVFKTKTSKNKRKVHKLLGIAKYQTKLFLEKLRLIKKSKNYYDPFDASDYNKWLKEQPMPDYNIKLYKKPLISIVTPVYNVAKEYLKECIESVMYQNYENWELILVDDASTNKETLEVLKEYEQKDERIKVIYREKNGNISEATNTGFANAKGDYIGLLDNDDTISIDALFHVVKAINKHHGIDFIYSDEDKLDINGQRCIPYFKSDFAPDTLLSNNYICHFTVFSKELLKKVGGEKTEFNGAQDYDLILRMTEKANKIHHINRVLYHWRIIPGSTSESITAKEYAIKAGQRAIESALKRRKIDGSVDSNNDGTYIVKYKIDNPHVTIIIPTKDYATTLKTCIDSIYEKSTYKNYDILVVNNNSVEEETFALFNKYKKEKNNFEVLDISCPFNYSYLMNEAVKKSKGDYILFLNNDTEVITPDFIEQMLMYATQKHIGMVGTKLLFPDRTIQHAGVVLGIKSMAAHAYEYLDESYPYSFGKLNMPTNYAAVTMACAMLSKKKFNEVKGMNEELANNFNDVELCIKLLAKNYYNVCLGNVVLFHYESKTRGKDKTKKQFERTSKERNIVNKKWSKIINNDPFYNPNLSKDNIYKLEKRIWK